MKSLQTKPYARWPYLGGEIFLETEKKKKTPPALYRRGTAETVCDFYTLRNNIAGIINRLEIVTYYSCE